LGETGDGRGEGSPGARPARAGAPPGDGFDDVFSDAPLGWSSTAAALRDSGHEERTHKNEDEQANSKERKAGRREGQR
jgi:hypothetical protein